MIRHATIEDLNILYEIECACFPENEKASFDALKRRLNAHPECFYLYYDESIISFINGIRTNTYHLVDEMYEDPSYYVKNGKYFMIFGVDTLPAYQGLGYASIVMKYMIDDLTKKGVEEIVLTCKENLISFYERFGFINESISTSTHGNQLWYEMRLKGGIK